MAQPSIPAEQGSLERLGIPNETEMPDGILTPSAIRQVRFRQQASRGYYTKDVEAFVNEQATISVEWYIQRLQARDGDVHRLGEELDRLEVDLINMRGQLELAAASAPLAEAIRDAQQDPEVEAIVNKAKRTEADLERANLRIAALEEDLAAAASTAPAAAVQDIAAQERIAELEAELAASEQQVAGFAEQVQAMETYSDQQDEYIDLLLAQLPAEAGEQATTEAEPAEGAEQQPSLPEEIERSAEPEQAVAAEPETVADEPRGSEYLEPEYPEHEAEPDVQRTREAQPTDQQRHVWNGVELPDGLTPEDFE